MFKEAVTGLILH